MSLLSLFDAFESDGEGEERSAPAEPAFLTVSELTAWVKSALERKFPEVALRGEVSNLSRPRSGHVYLSLKDDAAQVRAVLWKSDAQKLVFDLEDVVGAMPPDGLMAGRIAVEPGSFFEGVPAGADLYMLIRVLHDWSDEDCLRILGACRAAMGSGALLLIGEQILDPDPARGQPTDYLLDMQMMAIFGSARSRTEDEHRALLGQSGLRLQRVIPTASPV